MKMIVIEGLDGSGKTTQTDLLMQKLLSEDKPFLKIKLPDYESDSSALVKMYLNGDFGSDPKDVNAYAASAFYAVDRYANYKCKWAEDYKNGKLKYSRNYVNWKLEGEEIEYSEDGKVISKKIYSGDEEVKK